MKEVSNPMVTQNADSLQNVDTSGDAAGNRVSRPPRVIIVGGGLAGLAAAASLVEAGLIEMGFQVTLLEGRRSCGGRAASFEDPLTGGLVDACQHVAMGCCTNFIALCRQAGIAPSLRRDRTLWFISPTGVRSACTPSRWLPAPLHMTPLLWGMRHFSWREKLSLALGMFKLARHCPAPANKGEPLVQASQANSQSNIPTALSWLQAIGQLERVINLFWQPVLESALGESIDLVSVSAARKVVVDGFLAHRKAADLYVPTKPLGQLFGDQLVAWLKSSGVSVETGRTVTAIQRSDTDRATGVVCGSVTFDCDCVIVALPWKQAARLLPDLVPVATQHLAGSSITAVHLWFDRPVIDLPHAVLVGRVSQWVFSADEAVSSGSQKNENGGYCQVVISASRGLLGGDRGRLLDTVVAELRDIFPAAREATLRESRIVTDSTAVLSVRPGVDAVRPAAVTSLPNLFLAGDWTATGWPSTMEGAVRSGRLAAQAAFGPLLEGISNIVVSRPHRWLAPDLRKNWLVRVLVKEPHGQSIPAKPMKLV